MAWVASAGSTGWWRSTASCRTAVAKALPAKVTDAVATHRPLAERTDGFAIDDLFVGD